MDTTEPPRIEFHMTKPNEIAIELKGESPVIVGNDNIVFPSHWTSEQCEAWMKKYRPDRLQEPR